MKVQDIQDQKRKIKDIIEENNQKVFHEKNKSYLAIKDTAVKFKKS